MNKDLRIVFMGTPEFAVESLKALLEHQLNVVAVITAPDRPAGRGQQLRQSAVKQFALKKNLPVLQPKNLKSKQFLKELEALNHNLQVVVAFRLLPEAVFSMPEYGSFNLHGSLLPQYRGAAPINWAVINGETQTGVTTFFLKRKVDTGNIILQKSLPITDNDTAGDVHDKLMVLGAEVVVETCKLIQQGIAEPQPQHTDEIELLPAPKIFREDCEINWAQNTAAVYNFIRGLSPYPAAWTNLHQQNFKIFKAEKIIEDHSMQPGNIHTDGKKFLHFATTDGYINCLVVQLQGKRRMQIDDFLRGYQFPEE